MTKKTPKLESSPATAQAQLYKLSPTGLRVPRTSTYTAARSILGCSDLWRMARDRRRRPAGAKPKMLDPESFPARVGYVLHELDLPIPAAVILGLVIAFDHPEWAQAFILDARGQGSKSVGAERGLRSAAYLVELVPTRSE